MANKIDDKIRKEISKLSWQITAVLFIFFLLLLVAFYFILTGVFGSPMQTWLPEMGIAGFIFLLAIATTFTLLDKLGERTLRNTLNGLLRELKDLRAANKRAESLQKMASVLRATLSFERVVEEALNVISVGMQESGIPRQSLVGAVFLFNGGGLIPVAASRLTHKDLQQILPGQSGALADAMSQAEIVVTHAPRQDPELRSIVAFQNCTTVAIIPLRAGFQIYGAMVIGSTMEVDFDPDHYKLFLAVADQAVIALQNAQLYQELEDEKKRLIEADEEARKELARDLHDGPTQTIAAIAMRVNFIKTLVSRDPQQAIEELIKVEELAKSTSKEIRGMLFTLRPLVLETQGLKAAVETLIKRMKENDGLNVRLVGGEYADLISDKAQSVVFSIVEEALGNARKYSKAKLIEVRFWQEDNLFVARVQDDGVGFDTQDVNRDYSSRGSLGMVNMRERADRVNGSLRVESEPGRGTSVTLVVPLDKHGRNAPQRVNHHR